MCDDLGGAFSSFKGNGERIESQVPFPVPFPVPSTVSIAIAEEGEQREAPFGRISYQIASWAISRCLSRPLVQVRPSPSAEYLSRRCCKTSELITAVLLSARACPAPSKIHTITAPPLRSQPPSNSRPTNPSGGRSSRRPQHFVPGGTDAILSLSVASHRVVSQSPLITDWTVGYQHLSGTASFFQLPTC